MIYRGFVGKEFPQFQVEITEEFSAQIMELFRAMDPPPGGGLPSNWPAFMALQGTACLFTVWEELGVDPIGLRVFQEEFVHLRRPKLGESLFGRVTVEDVSDHMEPSQGIEEQVDLAVRFHDSDGHLVAKYRCSYRVPVAQTSQQRDEKLR